MTLYAYTASSYRAIASASDVAEGESVGEIVPPEVLSAIEEQQARNQRDELLRTSDWTQIGDNSLTAAQRTEWAVYRQALRDLPQQPGFPDVVWPSVPTLPQGAAGGGSTPIP